MKTYIIECNLRARFEVEAESDEEALRIVSEPLDEATIHVIEDGEVELEGEAMLIGDAEITRRIR